MFRNIDINLIIYLFIIITLSVMYYKIIILVIITLFIGANLLCGCCRYPIFDLITGNSSCSASSILEGQTNLGSSTGTVGSNQAVDEAKKDIAKLNLDKQPIPAVVTETAAPSKEQKAGFMDMSTIINAALGGVKPIEQKITSNTKEGMDTMGADVNEVQNSDVAGMWVSKANTYASEFGYQAINNTGSAYTADEPLKNGSLVMFAKNKFKPECCPSPYSSSSGCVCMTPEQINYLNTRGGNRTTDSGI
jgi:hypothetical protein